MEKQPSININLGGTSFEMNQRNSSLHTFLGRAALYNHVNLVRDDLPEEDGQVCMTPLYRDLMTNKNIWDRMAQLMSEKDFPMYLNQLTIAPATITNYEETALFQMKQEMERNDGVPEGWL